MSATVGDRIQRVLDQVELTQRDLAAETGISQSTLSRIISGERKAKTPELASI
ncbi:MAG: helix-turn-helix transcriptional regulator, partial [Nocardia sp.]|nr:helix-turn-helix transcriptional regulator [Nocardia sp.]